MSKIEWTDETWNPVIGCTKVTAGCKNCYAERMHKRLTAMGVEKYSLPFSVVKVCPSTLDAPLRWRKPRKVFVNSMSDLFHDDVPSDYIERVWRTMMVATGHTFQILTKRPTRMLDWFAWLAEQPVWRVHALTGSTCWPLPNVWLGVSVHDQESADYAIPLLLQTPAAVRWVSYEPALGPVDFSPWLECHMRCGWDDCPHGPYLDWIVCGGESGPGARPPHPQWARSVRDQCRNSGTAFLFKQWGEWAPSATAAGPRCILRVDGTQKEGICNHGLGEELMVRAGKRVNGRLLDGVLHDEYPEVIRLEEAQRG